MPEVAGSPAVIRLLIVASPLWQAALAALFNRRSDLDTVATVSLADAVSAAKRLLPDVVITELPPKSSEVVSVLRALAKLRPAPRVVALSHYGGRAQLTAVIEAGAHACVSHDSSLDQLEAALAAVRRGQRYLAPAITELIMSSTGGLVAPATASAEIERRLTTRERQVLLLIVQGKTERTIAAEMGLSPKTVHTHRTSIMSKLDVHNVIGLVRRALHLGLVDI